MIIDYYGIPFGGQLLIWTSRIAFYGSCRTTPNKYEAIDIAYSKIGIKGGSYLFKPFIEILKNKKNFIIQPFCKRYLNKTEINLINCIEYNKNESYDNEYFIKEWELDKQKKEFNFYTRKIANYFIEVKLETDIYRSNNYLVRQKTDELNLKTLH